MTDHKPSSIKEAPSLADITSAGDRVGKVDFTAKLSDRMDPAPEPEEAVSSLASMARPQRPAGEPDDDSAKMPFILPPATVDLAMAAEAQRTKQEIAAARGELPDEDDELLDREGLLDDDGENQEAPVAVISPSGLSGLQRVIADEVAGSPAEAPEGPSGPPEGLLIQEVADLDAVAAAGVAHHDTDREHREDAVEVARLEVETEAAAQAVQEPLARTAFLIDRAQLVAFEDPAHDQPTAEQLSRAADQAPLRSVTEVAHSVIAAMRQINEAHERHVESLELETARRCELLTAQAELDAELIRLHARREAHSIISTARLRSGENDTETVETDQLGEIGETFSRFAESIETTVATSPVSPDHLRKS